MVVKIQNSYASMKRTIDYNEDKVSEGAAERIAILNFEASDAREVYEMFEYFERRNIRTSNVSFQMSINPNPENGEKLSDEQVTDLTEKLMKYLGYGNQPIVIYRHNDIDREHFHVMSIRTDINGKKIKDYKEKKDVMRCLRSLQQEFGFTIGKEKTPEPNEETRKQQNNTRTPVLFNPVESDISKRYLQAFEAAMEYRFKSFTQLKAIMQWYGINLTKQYDNRNEVLCFQAVDSKGKGIALQLTETALDRSLMNEMDEKISENSADTRRYLPERRHIESVMHSALKNSTSLEDLKEILSKKRIGLLVSRNTDGNIFGLTVVDHDRRMAFKGTEISKEITARIFTQLEQNGWDTSILPETNAQARHESVSDGVSRGASDALSDSRPDSSYTPEQRTNDATDVITDVLTLMTEIASPAGGPNSDAQRNPSSDAQRARKKKGKKKKH